MKLEDDKLSRKETKKYLSIWEARIIIYFCKETKGKAWGINKFFNISRTNVNQYAPAFKSLCESKNGRPPFLIQLENGEYQYNEKSKDIDRAFMIDLYSSYGDFIINLLTKGTKFTFFELMTKLAKIGIDSKNKYSSYIKVDSPEQANNKLESELNKFY